LFSLPNNAAITTSLSTFTKNVTAPWMIYALAALALFGIAAILQKLATNNISSELSTVCFALGFIPVALYLVATQKLVWPPTPAGWGLSILLGAMIGIGGLTLFAAYRDGKASVVT